MLTYSTKFKVKETFTKEQFVKSVIKWCKEKNYPMHNLEQHISELTFSEIDNNQTIEVINSNELNIIAARHTSETSKGNWIVDAVLNYSNNMLTVYMDYTVNENIQTAKVRRRAPWLINYVISDEFAENNLGFKLQTTAISIDDTNKDILLSAIEANDIYSLPVVYLSSKSKLQADSLALKLSGLAIVVTDANDILYNMDSEKYSKPIYLFIPHKMIEPIAFDEFPEHRDIVHKVTDFLNNRNYNKLETWEGINNEILRLKTKETIENMKKQSSENEFQMTYLKELEEENEKSAQEYEKLLKEVNNLKVQNELLNYNLETYSSSGTPVIVSGTEKDLYPNEQTEIIMEILKEYLSKSIEDDCRRADIIKSLIDANHVKGLPEEYKKIIKTAFDGYTQFHCNKILNALKETGIEIVDHTGHYKIQYHSDPRYSFEAAATPSDFRAGKNAASIINKLMF